MKRTTENRAAPYSIKFKGGITADMRFLFDPHLQALLAERGVPDFIDGTGFIRVRPEHQDAVTQLIVDSGLIVNEK